MVKTPAGKHRGNPIQPCRNDDASSTKTSSKLRQASRLQDETKSFCGCCFSFKVSRTLHALLLTMEIQTGQIMCKNIYNYRTLKILIKKD